MSGRYFLHPLTADVLLLVPLFQKYFLKFFFVSRTYRWGIFIKYQYSLYSKQSGWAVRILQTVSSSDNANIDHFIETNSFGHLVAFSMRPTYEFHHIRWSTITLIASFNTGISRSTLHCLTSNRRDFNFEFCNLFTKRALLRIHTLYAPVRSMFSSGLLLCVDINVVAKQNILNIEKKIPFQTSPAYPFNILPFPIYAPPHQVYFH